MEGSVRIVTSNGIIKMKGHDFGDEFMEETWIFKVVKNHKPGDLHLEQGNLDLACNVWVDLSLSGKSAGGFIAA